MDIKTFKGRGGLALKLGVGCLATATKRADPVPDVRVPASLSRWLPETLDTEQVQRPLRGPGLGACCRRLGLLDIELGSLAFDVALIDLPRTEAGNDQEGCRDANGEG